MNAVLNWVKSNLYAVIFVLIMIAAPVAMWIVSGKMNASVRQEVQQRSGRISELGKIEKTSVKLSNPVPGNEAVNASVVVNRRLLDRFNEVAEQINDDAERVRRMVLQMNQKDRGVLLDSLFPAPAVHERETLPVDMYLALRRAYEQLLADVGAGSPPSLEIMREELAAANERFKTQILMKEAREDLTEEEVTWLTEQLTDVRLSEYADAARHISLYVTIDDLGVPNENQTPVSAEGDGLAQMFTWQWDFWIVQDILGAFGRANEPYSSVLEAPVKRLVSLTVLDEPQSSGASAGDAGAPTGGFSAGGARGGRRSSSSTSATGEGGGTTANASREVPLDFSVSLTGRTTNSLYDVRHVRVVLIADSAKLPEVFDALARQNFMTVLDADIEPVDLYKAAAAGYIYGGSAVSQVTLELETIWLRQWTAQFMPDEVKSVLGIAITPGENDKG